MAENELLALLNSLLEAERAGAQVAKISLKETTDPALQALLADVHQDEVKWCGMLLDAVHRLGGETSRVVGAFRDKALALPNMTERLALLNRGQDWVVRKIAAALEMNPDAETRAGLVAMQEAHRANIARTEMVLKV